MRQRTDEMSLSHKSQLYSPAFADVAFVAPQTEHAAAAASFRNVHEAQAQVEAAMAPRAVRGSEGSSASAGPG